MRKLRNSRAAAVGFDDREQAEAGDEVVEAPRAGGNTRHVETEKRLLRVLVADDNQDAADSLSMIVKLWHHEVRVAYGGTAALELTFAYEPDVLLLDVAMPELNGYELARQIRRVGRFADVLLIAVSGYADEGHRLLGEASGFDHYLVKPCELSDLEVLLRREQDRLADSKRAHLSASQKMAILAINHGLAFHRKLAEEGGNGERERRTT